MCCLAMYLLCISSQLGRQAEGAKGIEPDSSLLIPGGEQIKHLQGLGRGIARVVCGGGQVVGISGGGVADVEDQGGRGAEL